MSYRPYIAMGDIQGMIPLKFLIEGLDDNGDGEADGAAIDAVFTQASQAVDGLLEGRFTTPFTNPIPKIVIEATKIFAAELIYQRRGTKAEENPFTKQANQYRDPKDGKLGKIARGEEPLYPTIQRQLPSATAVTQPSKTSSSTGKLSV